jgi:hypothetical protein
MLLGVVSVLVIVATGDPGDGSTRAIEQALRAALGREAAIVVRPASEPSAPATDEALTAAAASERAGILGVVSWSDKQRRVVIRFVKPPDGRWTDREVRFDAADAPNERGRTVGFALASMMPDEAFPSADRRKSDAEADPAAPLPIPPTPPATGVATGSPGPDAHPAVPPRPNPLALDLSALAVTAPGGYGGGVGGAVAIRIPLRGAVGLRGGLSARGGQIGPAQATSRVIVGGVGMAWQPWLDPARRWAVGARLDGLLLFHDVSHLSQDDSQAAHLSRFIPGVDVAVEGAYRFSDHAAAVGALGAEVAFGRTDVVVRQEPVASLPPGRVLVELGLRVSF